MTGKILAGVLGAACFALAPAMLHADPQSDLEIYQRFFKQKYPDIPFMQFADGAYALNEQMRQNWEAIEEFPPYGPFVDSGEKLWSTPFANGKGYRDCFPEGPAMQHKFPRWDKEQGQVVTLSLALNQCRETHGEKKMKYKGSPLVDLLSYVAYQSRGKKINVVVPKDDPRALAAYQKGKDFYFTRRGQLNFSCAHCHFKNSGMSLRTDILSTAVGQTTGWPVYRSKWGTAGTLHRRYTGCNKQVRAKPFKRESEQYRNLEYFHTHMSNGLALNGPSARK